jgi:hypothetical protein
LLSVVKGAKPKDQIEAMLAAQMAAVHTATMTFARRLANVENIAQQDTLHDGVRLPKADRDMGLRAVELLPVGAMAITGTATSPPKPRNSAVDFGH